MIDWSELWTLATLIAQEDKVFEASVREKPSFGKPADEVALRRTVLAGVFDKVLERLLEGLAGPLNERGGNLSGGQR